MRQTTDTRLAVCLTHSETMIVEDRHTVPQVAREWPGFSDMPPVFATALMIGFVEQTCIQALRPFLEHGQQTVGTHINLSHSAPTSSGDVVTANIELLSIAGRKLKFSVRCKNGNSEIGRGFHERAIINVESFLTRQTNRN